GPGRRRRRQPGRHREPARAVRLPRATGHAEVARGRRQPASRDEGRAGGRHAADPRHAAATVRPARPALAAALALAVLAIAPAPTRAQSPTEDMQQYTDEVARMIRDVGSREKDTLGALQDGMRRLAFQILGAPEAAREA